VAEGPDDLLNLTEAGEVLRVHRLVVGRYIREGKIPGVRGDRGQWLVRRSDIDAWLLSNPYPTRSTAAGLNDVKPD
jgi:excisionase family DNA binding protein